MRGSTAHNIGLDDHGSPTQKSLKIAVKRCFGPKIFFACGALKGASPRGPCLTAQNRLPWPSPSYPSAEGISQNPGHLRRARAAASLRGVVPCRVSAQARAPQTPQPTCGGRGRRLHCAAWSCVRAVFVGTHHPSPCANLLSIPCMHTYSDFCLPCMWVRLSSVCCCYTL